MRIELNDGYIIKNDSDKSLILAKIGGAYIDKKTGKSRVKEEVISYHTTLEAAIQSYAKVRLFKSEAKTLQEALGIEYRIKQEIKFLLEKEQKHA